MKGKSSVLFTVWFGQLSWETLGKTRKEVLDMMENSDCVYIVKVGGL